MSHGSDAVKFERYLHKRFEFMTLAKNNMTYLPTTWMKLKTFPKETQVISRVVRFDQ